MTPVLKRGRMYLALLRSFATQDSWQKAKLAAAEHIDAMHDVEEKLADEDFEDVHPLIEKDLALFLGAKA